MSELVEFLKKKPYFLARKPAEKKEIESVEKMLGVSFSQEYLAYLAEVGAASIYGHEITGICDNQAANVVDVTTNAREYLGYIPEGKYVIEDLHIDGTTIWQDNLGTVYIAQKGKEMQKIAESILEYLEK